jgi:hypothetical protein
VASIYSTPPFVARLVFAARRASLALCAWKAPREVRRECGHASSDSDSSDRHASHRPPEGYEVSEASVQSQTAIHASQSALEHGRITRAEPHAGQFPSTI